MSSPTNEPREPAAQEPPVVTAPQSPHTAQRISRRKMLAGAGAGTLVLVAGGTVWRAADQGVFSTGQGAAYAPWDDWRTPTQGPLNLVRAAILAANPHDSQPWLFHVSESRSETHIDLYADARHRIGLADPFLSELYMGLGCALENLVLAAPANGFTSQVTLFPDLTDATRDATHVARVDLQLGPTSAPTTASALYQAIPHRHTNRYPYDTKRPVTEATLEALRTLNTDSLVRVVWVTDATMRQHLGNLMVEAARAFVADKPLVRDDDRWYRATWQDVQRFRDGITLDAAGLPDLTRLLGKLLPPASADQQHAYFVKGVQTQVQTAGMLGMLAVHNKRDNAQRVQAGRVWQRMHLWATTQGVAMQPLNQLTEMADREAVLASTSTSTRHFGDALRDLISDPDWQVLLSFRTGYPTHEALRSPRRAVSTVVLP
jgi:hypothetical protein